MRKLLNSLYIIDETAYLTLDGENVVCRTKNEDGEYSGEKFRLPFTTIEDIYLFSYIGCSPALMGKCTEYGIPINFISPQGKIFGESSRQAEGQRLSAESAV